MILWKEWRETRFGFLVSLIFLSGVFYTIPANKTLMDEFWLVIFLAFFVAGLAIAMGSNAVAAEVDAGTAAFLLSKPARRTKFLVIKYIVRAVEVTIVFAVPMVCMIDWTSRDGFMWVPPYLSQQYQLIGLLIILFVYSFAFLCSVIFRKQAWCVLASIGILAAYFSLRGVSMLQGVLEGQQIMGDLQILGLLSLAAFALSIWVFKRREF